MNRISLALSIVAYIVAFPVAAEDVSDGVASIARIASWT